MKGTNTSIITDVIYFLVNHYQWFLIAPIILAFKAEQHYVGRAAILANTVGMFVAVAPKWDETYSWLNINGFPLFQFYVIVGLIFGFVAFISYIFDESMEGDFYTFTFILYNSIVAGIVCFMSAFLL